MDRQSKRKRTDEDDGLIPPRSLSRTISPLRKCRRQEGMTINSPWQLTAVHGLPEEFNQDTVTLKDLLGDPLIKECWEFNFLLDIPFIMDAFDPDTRHLVQLHIVHGFWKSQDVHKLLLMHDAANFTNVHLHEAPMPEVFGTHHTKMMILIRHDDTAQVIIHTANMIPQDWTNMCNAVWRSPMLPKVAPSNKRCEADASTAAGDSAGGKFKSDLLRYLRSYDRRRPTCGVLVDELMQYDFSPVRAALVASVPGRHDARSTTAWGWAALKQKLRSVPCEEGEATIVAQASTIATLGAKEDWLQRTFFDTLATDGNPGSAARKRPKYKVVFPTAEEIRRSLDGYLSGGSIHTKIQSQQQVKQLQYLRPLLHLWANDIDSSQMQKDETKVRNSGRNRAAPHIKTYIRFNEDTIDWALLTSANLSKKAWGEATKASGEMRVASWEIGVLVWPALYDEGAVMVGTFGSDAPQAESAHRNGKNSVVGLRMPYSMPLQRYGADELPWVASMSHTKVDCLGRTWEI